MNLDLALYRELDKILSEEQDQLAAEIVAGKAVDWPDYRFRIGRLRGISDALKAAQEAQKRILGIEREN